MQTVKDLLCAILATVVIVVLGILPNILFQIAGWTSSGMDALSRFLGCMIGLFLIMWYTNRGN